MVAYGAGSMVCAVFSGYITAGSVARSLVQETTGGRTQVSFLVVRQFYYKLYLLKTKEHIFTNSALNKRAII